MPRKTPSSRVDLRTIHGYSVSLASRYLRVPTATVNSWAKGRSYPIGGGWRRSEPILSLVGEGPHPLSFFNLVEIHILGALRRDDSLRLESIRDALAYVQEKLGVERPLIHQDFQTDGVFLFVDKFGQLINASKHGQSALREIVQVYLRRVEADAGGLAFRFYPFSRGPSADDAPKLIAIDPRISFGRPFIAKLYRGGEVVSWTAETG